MAVLGVSSITPVFPDLVRELGISGVEVGLLITFFTLPGVFLAPVLGVLADRFGRKKILIPSIIFVTSSKYYRNLLWPFVKETWWIPSVYYRKNLTELAKQQGETT